MSQERTYTGEQVARAARALREIAGAGEERFSARQVLSMLGDELRLLREKGFTEDRIAELFRGYDIAVNADDLQTSSNDPRNG